MFVGHVGVNVTDLDRSIAFYQRVFGLDLPQMVTANSGLHNTAFTVSVDLRPGATTGIPAPERARTIQALADPGTQPDDLARPGHIFPLRAKSEEAQPCRLARRPQPGHEVSGRGHNLQSCTYI